MVEGLGDGEPAGGVEHEQAFQQDDGLLRCGREQARVRHLLLSRPWRGRVGDDYFFIDPGYGRGGIPIFTSVFEPLAQVAPYPTD